MAQMKYDNGGAHIAIQSSQAFLPQSVLVHDFLMALADLKVAAHLVKFRLKPTNTPNEFSYEFDTADGKHWNQTLSIPPAGVSSMTFDVQEPWRLDEFAPHRAVRDAVIKLVQLEGVNDIKGDW